MTNTTQQYLLNNLSTHLSLKKDYLNIAPNSFVPIHSWELEDESIRYAIERSWVEVLNEKPKNSAVEKSEVKIEITTPYAGLTFDELQAELVIKAAETAQKAADKESKEKALGTPSVPEPVVITEITLPRPATEPVAEVEEEKVVAKTKKTK